MSAALWSHCVPGTSLGSHAAAQAVCIELTEARREPSDYVGLVARLPFRIGRRLTCVPEKAA